MASRLARRVRISPGPPRRPGAQPSAASASPKAVRAFSPASQSPKTSQATSSQSAVCSRAAASSRCSDPAFRAAVSAAS